MIAGQPLQNLIAIVLRASALTAVRNANFYISARRQVSDFQPRHARHNRSPAAKAANRVSVIIEARVVNAHRVAQFAFVMPPLAVRTFIRLMAGVRAPTAHVESVVSATLCEQRTLHPRRSFVTSRGDGRENIPVHRSLPPPRTTFRAAEEPKSVRSPAHYSGIPTRIPLRYVNSVLLCARIFGPPALGGQKHWRQSNERHPPAARLLGEMFADVAGIRRAVALEPCVEFAQGVSGNPRRVDRVRS